VRETVIADEVMMTADLGFCATAGASLIDFASRKVDAKLSAYSIAACASG
jgi:hypothetical protein